MKAQDKDQGPRPPRDEAGISRRSFLKGTGLAVAAAGIGGRTANAAPGSREDVPIFGPDAVPISFKLNGNAVEVEAMPSTTLLDLIRDQLDLTGSKRVCDRGSCGACTVHVNGKTVCSCSMLAIDVVGAEVRTIEGLSAEDGSLNDLQAAFVECDALQCGFCTPGMIMSCQALLSANPKPDRAAIAEGISGNICRCGTYQNVFEAVEKASGQGGGK